MPESWELGGIVKPNAFGYKTTLAFCVQLSHLGSPRRVIRILDAQVELEE